MAASCLWILQGHLTNILTVQLVRDTIILSWIKWKVAEPSETVSFVLNICAISSYLVKCFTKANLKYRSDAGQEEKSKTWQAWMCGGKEKRGSFQGVVFFNRKSHQTGTKATAGAQPHPDWKSDQCTAGHRFMSMGTGATCSQPFFLQAEGLSLHVRIYTFHTPLPWEEVEGLGNGCHLPTYLCLKTRRGHMESVSDLTACLSCLWLSHSISWKQFQAFDL